MTDFSFEKCLRPPTHRQLVLGAMRHEVSSQVYEFKEREYASGTPVLCAINGHVVEWHKAHVDHSSPTFVELASEFVSEQGGWDNIGVVRADGSIGVQLGQERQASAWRGYHRDNCRLQIVCIKANLSLLKRGAKRSG